VRLNSEAMNPMLMKALAAVVPVSLLLVDSVAVFVTRKTFLTMKNGAIREMFGSIM